MFVTIGPLLLTGFSDGDSITARKNANFYESRAGLDGSVGRARVTDKRGQIELHLLQTSAANDELSALMTGSNGEGTQFSIVNQYIKLAGWYRTA